MPNVSWGFAATGKGSKVSAMTRMCCVCNKIEQGGEWRPFRPLVAAELVTHGYCPQCFVSAMAEVEDYIGDQRISAFAAGADLVTYCAGGPCA